MIFIVVEQLQSDYMVFYQKYFLNGMQNVSLLSALKKSKKFHLLLKLFRNFYLFNSKLPQKFAKQKKQNKTKQTPKQRPPPRKKQNKTNKQKHKSYII